MLLIDDLCIFFDENAFTNCAFYHLNCLITLNLKNFYGMSDAQRISPFFISFILVMKLNLTKIIKIMYVNAFIIT